MDFRDILKSFDNLSEGTTTTDKGTVHKAGPGGYGNRHGAETQTDQYGKPIGKVSLASLAPKDDKPKRKGRPPNPDTPLTGKDDPKNKKVPDLFGRTTGSVPKGKKGTEYGLTADEKEEKKKEKAGKKGLKEYFDQLDQALSEGGLSVQPIPAPKQQTGQNFMIKDPSNPQAAAITTSDPAVVDAAKKGTLSMHKPGASPTQTNATPTTGAGSQVAPMEEGGDVGKHNNATTGFDALVRKLTPKYGKESAMKIAGAQLKKIKEAQGLSEAEPVPGKYSGHFYDAKLLSNGDYEIIKINSKKDDKGNTNPLKLQVGSVVPKGKAHSLQYVNDGGMFDETNRAEIVAQFRAQQKKIKEAEAPQNFAQSSPMSAGGRNPNSLEEGKKTIKKDDRAEKDGKKVTKDLEYDMGHKGKDDAKAEKAGKKVTKDIEYDDKKKKKTKVKEGMEHHLQAARLEGKSHALRKMPYSCSHDDMEAARHYHEGFKEGLDECYGQMPILGRTAVGEVSSEVGDMASFGAHTPTMEGLHDDAMAGLQRTVDFAKQHGYRVLRSPAGKVMKFINKAIDHTLVARVDNEGDSINVNFEDWSSGTSGNDDASYFDQTFKDYYEKALEDHKYRLSQDEEDLDEVSRGKWLDQQARKPGDTFKAFGQTFHDKDVLEDSPFFESLETQLNALLESKEDVAEGMTVSISKGQQGAPDSVSVSAQDGEADQLLSIIKTAGLGLFGGEDKGFSAPEGSAGAHGGISVVDDHDGMMALMKKLSGGAETSSHDFADEEGHSEEGHEEHSHDEEDSCNECGMAYESCGCDHKDKEVVDEVESEDQMAYEVAEDNPPDNGSANSTNDMQGNAAANQALATADAEENVSEDDTCDKCHSDPCKCDDEKEGVAEGLTESYANSADDAFEADIDFMMNIISGGLNKRKSTGQTTIPVVASQLNRTVSTDTTDINESVTDWKKLAGI